MSSSSRLWKLELLRGLAAVAVVVWHFALIFPDLGKSELRNAVASWGITSVFIFFVLSGAVICLSTERGGFGVVSFLWRRALRIVPLYLLALLLTVAVDPAPFSASKVAGHCFFGATLPGWIVPTFEFNPVLWTLSYEMSFYFIFAIMRGPQKFGLLVGTLLALTAGASVFWPVSLPPWVEHVRSVFAFYGVWLIGYFAVKFRWRLPFSAASALFTAGCIPMMARATVNGGYPDYGQAMLIGFVLAPLLATWVPRGSELGNRQATWVWTAVIYLVCLILFLMLSRSRLHASVLYALFPFVVLGAGLLWSKLRAPKQLVAFAGWLGLISYALYLFHYPIFAVTRQLFGPENGLAALAALFLVFAVAYVAEAKLQPAIARAFKRSDTEGR